MEVLNPSGHRVESLRVRCPRCATLYMVQTRDIRETKPRFECVSCHEKFWIPFPECASYEEVIGLRWDHWETKIKKPAAGGTNALGGCPKCHKPLNPEIEDCPHCGVIPGRYLALKSGSRIQGSDRLGTLWRRIIDDYANEGLHQEFLKASTFENNLAYASTQYAQILKLMPSDERAIAMIKEIEALVTIPISRSEAIRVSSSRKRAPRWVHVTLGLGLLMVALGIFFPLFRNLTGAGAAVVFITLGFRLNFFRI